MATKSGRSVGAGFGRTRFIFWILVGGLVALEGTFAVTVRFRFLLVVAWRPSPGSGRERSSQTVPEKGLYRIVFAIPHSFMVLPV